jgi:hypothetical protein
MGIDLTPIQPPWVPPNLKFIVDDIEEDEWLNGSDFDLVHLRQMTPLVKDLDKLFRHSFEYGPIRSGFSIRLQEKKARAWLRTRS